MTEQECLSCGFYTKCDDYPVDPGHPEPGSTVALCSLCANTMTGRTVTGRSRSLREHATILQTICYVGNVILATLEEQETQDEQ